MWEKYDFEAMEFDELLDYKKLYQYIKERMVDHKRMYIFLDEVQNVAMYEKVVDSLYVKEDIDVYITGSNSYIFSSQLATRLSGRYVEIPVLPFSFKEFYSLQKNLDKDSAFHEYMMVGGFPYITQAHLQKYCILSSHRFSRGMKECNFAIFVYSIIDIIHKICYNMLMKDIYINTQKQQYH